MVYNKVNPGQSVEYLQNNPIQPTDEHPRNEQYYSVDASLHNEAKMRNPDIKTLYPLQINSCKQLNARIAYDKETMNVLSSALEDTQDKLNQRAQQISTDTADRVQAAQEKQRQLLRKLCEVRTKAETILEAKQMLTIDRGAEM